MARAPKTPIQEAEARLRRWAKSTEFPQPLPWGELEAHIVSEPTPSHQELEIVFPPRTRRRFLPFLFVAPQTLLTSGSSLVGLGLVLAHVFGGVNDPTFGDITWFVFLVSIAMTLGPVLVSVTTRRRGAIQTAVSLGTAVVSVISFLVLRADPQYGVWSSIRTMAVVAALAGLASYLCLRLIARPSVRTTWREFMATPTVEDQWLHSQRALVLEVLAKRELMSRWDIPHVMELPRGAWRELESRPDGSIVRHHR